MVSAGLRGVCGVSRVVGVTSLLPWVGMLESREPQRLEGPGS